MQLPIFKNIKSPHVKKYAANTGWLFADFFLKQGINIIVGIYVARYLKPINYGYLGYSMVYLQILMPIALLGLNQLVIKALIQKEKSENIILGTAFIIKLISSFFTFLVIYFLSRTFETDYNLQWLIILASTTILASPFQVIDYLFQAKVQSKLVVYSQQISNVIGAITKLFLVWYQASLIFFVLVYILEVFILNVSLIYFYIRQGKSIFNWRYDKNVFNSYFNQLWPILLSGFFVAVYVRIDLVMIRYLGNETDLGIYNVAVKLSEPFYVIATLVLSSLFPAIVTGMQIGPEEYKKRIQKLYDILLWIAILGSALVTAFSSLIIDLTYGVDYKESVSVLVIYFWASPFVFLGVIGGNAMLVENKQKFAAILTFIGAVVNIILNAIFIPYFGVSGAAMATLISYCLASFVLNYIFVETRQIFKQQLNAFVAIPRIVKNIYAFIFKKN